MKPIETNLKLSQKGIALVSAILLMELVFVGWLYGLLQQSELYAAQLARSKAIISKKDEILQLLSEASNSFTYRSVKEALASHEYENAVKKFPVVLGELRVLLKNEPDRVVILNDAETLINSEVQLMEQMRERLLAIDKDGTLGGMMDLAKIHRVKRRAEHTRDAIIQLLFNLDAPERKLEAELPLLEGKTRQSLRQSLLVGAVFNVVLALALGLAFVRSITSRVEILVDNTIRLSKKQQLNPIMAGSDEIAHLDKTFHAVEAALREAEKRDLEIQKMKEEFIAMASHELRSPLTSVQGALTLLSEGVFGEIPVEAKDCVNRAENNVSRLVALINDLLDTEKMKSGKLDMNIRETDLCEVIMKSVSAVSDLADGRQVEIVGTEPDTIIEADRERLIQVLVNLLSNAIKYSPKGGRIDLDVDEADDASVLISVKDEGPGIPEAYRASIFEKFEQVAGGVDKPHGTGLGLAIAKQIIVQHGGTIGVDSEEGKGSTFWFRIPRSSSKLLATAEHEDSSEEQRAGEECHRY